MKIKILSLLVLFVFVANVAAKKEAKESKESDHKPSMDMRYGARIGTNFSWVSGYPVSVLGWQVGGAADIPLKQIKMGHKYGLIDLQPEVMFVSKGGQWILGDELSAYYIEVPISGSFKFIINQNFAVRADIGPYFALGLFGSSEVGNEAAFSEKNLSRIDIGMHYGVAIEFIKDFYFAVSQSNGWTNDNVNSFYTTLGYNF